MTKREKMIEIIEQAAKTSLNQTGLSVFVYNIKEYDLTIRQIVQSVKKLKEKIKNIPNVDFAFDKNKHLKILHKLLNKLVNIYFE